MREVSHFLLVSLLVCKKASSFSFLVVELFCMHSDPVVVFFLQMHLPLESVLCPVPI
jgi:hypothetical protein